MTGSHGLRPSFTLALGLALGMAIPATAVRAGEPHWVTRDGRKIRLFKSDSELAVTFKKAARVEASARRLASHGLGIIEDVPGTDDAHHKLLRVADVSSKRRNLVRQDPEIEELRAVYRVEGTKSPLFATGTLLVRVKSDLSEADRDELWSTYELDVVETVEGLAHTYCLKPADGGEDEIIRAEALAADARTVWSQPNFRRRTIRKQIAPNDEFFPLQWHLENTGQLGGTPGADISVLEAWVLSSGLDIRIGMFDDGCDVGHEDLFENYIGVGHDPTIGFNDEGADDPRPKQFGDKHGTAVMGLAVARANSRGVRGVAFQSQFTVSRGLAQLTSDLDIAGVYTFARQQKVDVHINSWGLETGTPNPQILIDAIKTAFIEGRDPDPDSDDDEPLGMVVVFASGNGTNNDGVGIELKQGDDLSTLDTAIGVGASDNNDRIASLSNYGEDIDVVAPGIAGSIGLTTTDNDDEFVAVDDGYNVGGFNSLGVADVDSDGRYTNALAGTSAACPIVAGVAALMLSANPLLTATNVRIVLEHTADRVSRDDADYGNITSRSLRYGHGRVNALEAVRSSMDALDNGGFTWPDRVAKLRIDDTTLRWNAPAGAREFLVIQSAGSFDFANPEQGRFPEAGLGGCYSREQFGCGIGSVSELSDLPTGVSLTAVVSCENECKADDEFTVNNVAPGGSVAYAVYGRNGIGRYSWGAEATLADDNGGGVNGGTTNVGPNVLIQAWPLEGTSPLLVTFNAQAEKTNLDIDLDRIVWDFDIFDDSTVDSTTAHATREYTVPAGGTRTFTARLTMFDVDGNLGTAQVDIRVEGATEGDSPVDASQSEVQLLVGIPGNIDSNLSEGTSPFEVLLTIDATNLPGTLQSVVWDLGDGTTATSLVVPHIYTNDTNSSLRIPIIATVFTSTQTLAATRILTVHPGAEEVEVPTPQLEGAGVSGVGGSATACGAVGMIPLLVGFAFLTLMRRRAR